MMNLSNKRCLVTGGASFIGSHLVEALLRIGAMVRVADDLSSGKRHHLSEVTNDLDFRQGNLKDIRFAAEAVSDCDLVFHLAADHGGRGYIATHPANCASNMALDNIVFETAAKADVEKVVFASSACVYPTDIQLKKQLLHEDMVDFSRCGGAFADEEYGWAKLMGELSLCAYHKQYGIKAVSARLSTVYGPRENESHALVALIAKAFIKQSPYEIWGNGEQTRGFTYIDDIVSGILRAAEYIDDGSAINVGTSDFISLNQIADEIFKVFDWTPEDGVKHLVDRPVGVLHRALDGRRAYALSGWQAETSLSEGIRRTVEWYVNSHDTATLREELGDLLMSR